MTELEKNRRAFLAWCLLLVLFFLIPFVHDKLGIYFICESVNAAVSLFWYLIPYAMLRCLYNMGGKWIVISGYLFGALWAPFFLAGFYFSGDFERLTTNRNLNLADWETIPGRPLAVRKCTYAFSMPLSRDVYETTIEDEFLPGIKKVEVIDQGRYHGCPLPQGARERFINRTVLALSFLRLY